MNNIINTVAYYLMKLVGILVMVLYFAHVIKGDQPILSKGFLLVMGLLFVAILVARKDVKKDE